MYIIPLTIDGRRGFSWAILNLLRTRRISFLGLTNTGLDDVAGEMLADALADTPPRATNQVSSKPEVLDLTQIAFGSEVRDRLEEAGEQAGVRVHLSSSNGPALRARC